MLSYARHLSPLWTSREHSPPVFALDKSSGLGEAHSGVLVRASRGADVT